ncbi:MAG: hypothetical protein WC310_01915 [Patescibacteria group bacterium]|jgi:antibiotic biosynthesis monooxygenase (ABM) superfamily enzyme
MKKVFWTGLVAGVVMVVINMALNPIFSSLFPWLKESYMNPVFRPWQDPIMMLFFLYPIALGFGLSFVWDKTKQLFGKSVFYNGLNFGLIYFFVGGIPAFLINFSSFNLPLVMILTWTIMGLIDGLLAGWILARLNKSIK